MDKYTQADLNNSALIIIDVLRDTLDKQPLEIPGTSAVLPKIKQLLDFYRENNKPIVHIIRIYKADASNVDLCRKKLVENGKRIFIKNSLGAELPQELFDLLLFFFTNRLYLFKIGGECAMRYKYECNTKDYTP